MISAATHAARAKHSKSNLAKAVETAEKDGYDSKKTRGDIERLFEARFGKKPYKWQMDVTEAMLVDLESSTPLSLQEQALGRPCHFVAPPVL
jgi:hypothetical protein